MTSQKTSEWEAISRSYKAHLVNLQLIKGEILRSACYIYQSSLKQFFLLQLITTRRRVHVKVSAHVTAQRAVGILVTSSSQ